MTKGNQFHSDCFLSEFRQVWSQLPADKKLLASEVINSLCGNDKDNEEAAGTLVEHIAPERREDLTKALARWIVEPCATAL